MKRKFLFPGTFDPFTIAHDAIVKRALSFADEIIIAIGINQQKKTLFTLERRIDFIKQLYIEEDRISVTSYDTLTIDFAIKRDVNFILRGVRNYNDFEYEKGMSEFNRKLTDIDTVILISEPEFAHVTSTLVRELISQKQYFESFIPQLK